MSHVFISYNQEEADFAFALSLRLEKAGFDTWLDKSRLRPGSDWSQEIDRGITEAFVLLVVMSPSAKASEYVTYEWSFALGTGIPVFPLLRKQTELHPRLNRLQYLNFTHEQPWEKLINELAELQKNRTQGLQIPKDTPPYIRHAIIALDSANRSDREGAIESLSEIQHPVSDDALVNALTHPLRDVRFAAALVLGKRGDARVLPNLINYLPPDIQNNIPETETIYANTFRELRHAFLSIGGESIGTLIEALGSKSGVVQNFAVRTLGELNEPASIPALSLLFEEQQEDYPFEDVSLVNIIRSITLIGGDDAVKFIKRQWIRLLSSIESGSVGSTELGKELHRAMIHLKSLDFITILSNSLECRDIDILTYSVNGLSYFAMLDNDFAGQIISRLVPLLDNHSHLPRSSKSSRNITLSNFVEQHIKRIGTPEATNVLKEWHARK